MDYAIFLPIFAIPRICSKFDFALNYAPNLPIYSNYAHYVWGQDTSQFETGMGRQGVDTVGGQRLQVYHRHYAQKVPIIPTTLSCTHYSQNYATIIVLL